MEDVSLTFDNKMFLKGLEEISKKLTDLSGHTEKSASKMSSGVSMSALSFIKINAALGIAKQGLAKLAQNIPEIGKTFSIAGDIITRNFLWPLRQQILPYLRQFLGWVRDHRAMFVRWGGALVSVFNIVVQGIKSAINILKPFYEAAMKFFKDVFGKTGDSIDKIVNMVLFKISAVMVYLEAVLKPTMEAIARIVLRTALAVKEFVLGIADAYEEMGGIGAEWDMFIQGLDDLSESLTGNADSWRTWGKVIGYLILGPIKALLATLGAVGTAISSIIDMIKFMSGNMTGEQLNYKFASKDEKAAMDAASKGVKAADAASLKASGITMLELDPAKKSDKKIVTTNNITVHANSEKDAEVVAGAVEKSLSQIMNDSYNASRAAKGGS